ncbi:MAG: hypothetical protein AABW73_02560 [Nanoarchaeota archaeon]
MSIYQKGKKDLFLEVYRDIVDQYLSANRVNKIRAGLHLTNCGKKDLIAIVHELSIRGTRAKWKNSSDSPRRKSKHSKKIIIHWTDRRLCYEKSESYQIDVHYMKEREEKREEWAKDFEERRKKNEIFANRSLYEEDENLKSPIVEAKREYLLMTK